MKHPSLKVVQRKQGQTAGTFDVYLIDSNGKRFRSKAELRKHFEKKQETRYFKTITFHLTFSTFNLSPVKENIFIKFINGP